jgi:hypothetical protein
MRLKNGGLDEATNKYNIYSLEGVHFDVCPLHDA